MILLYHKIDAEAKTEWWVTADAFYRQMIQLSGKDVVYLDDYDPTNPNQVVITFDGVYENVLRYAAPILQQFGFPFELFITGDTIGKTNEFDKVEPSSPFAGQDTLKKLVKSGGRLQWHTKTHRPIDKVSDDELVAEILTPSKLKSLDPKGFTWFAYAHGVADDRSAKLVEANYKGGLVCDDGNFNDKARWPRKTVFEDIKLTDEKVSLIVPCHNYGHYLIEAIDSVLAQTYLPDEIILSDDASTDNSYLIMKSYQKLYPNLIKVNRNTTNMGIEKHFAQAVSQTTGNFICFLGADNRIPSDYVARSLSALLANKDAAIAYNDCLLFGNRAEFMYGQYTKDFRGQKLELGNYLTRFPKFNDKSKRFILEQGNFIHGSSMYRRQAYEEVGGYTSRAKQHEDYALFQKMIKKGWSAVKVEGLYLEYRQHSPDQANQQFNYFAELSFLRQHYKQYQDLHKAMTELERKLVAAHQTIAAQTTVLEDIRQSTFWKLRKPYLLATGLVTKPRTTIKKTYWALKPKK